MKEFVCRNKKIKLEGKGVIMGILNVTPDSFSDGGKFISEQAAILKIKEMLMQGAHIIDIGAMSTRPDSKPITAQEEIVRLAPVLAETSKIDALVVSVDTVNTETAEFALRNGACIINDVSGVFNESMAEIVKKYGAGWIITHTAGVPSGSVVEYPKGVVAAVKDFFDYILDKCMSFGIEKNHICFDAGFGFAKTTADNVELLKNLEKVIIPDVAFLTALSRKRFIGELTDIANPADRLSGTLTADLIALMKGSDILRVHDVEETLQTIAIYNSIL